VAAATLGDAVRLVLPARRLLSRSRIRQVAAAQNDAGRDSAIRRWSSELRDALGVRLQLGGLRHIEPRRVYLLLSLHEGLVDVPLLLQLPVPMTFVARADLAAERPMDRLLQAGRPILINPEAPSALRVLLREAARAQVQGRSVAMFPQGTVLGVETSFQRGALAVARRLDLPVLPVVIAGSHRIWEHPFSPVLRRGQRVDMEVLAPRRVATADEYRALEREMKERAIAGPWASPRRYVPERDGYWDGYRFDIDPDYAALDEQISQHRRAVGADGTARATRTV
jgi:1-acyl-sn-glycerol-3-phosphate acyltransferase